MSEILSIPTEVWAFLLENDFINISECTLVGLCNKQLAETVLEEARRMKYKLEEAKKSPLSGTQTFVVPNELLGDTIKRLESTKREYEEMQKRLPATIKSIPTLTPAKDIQTYMRVYKMWKERNAEYSDEQSIQRNQKIFEQFNSIKDELKQQTQDLWGYGLSQMILNFLMFFKATFKYGLRDLMNWSGDVPMGMLQWLVHDKDRELEFREIDGKPVDIKLHDRYHDIPELVTIMSSGVAANCARYQLYYDLPDLPTCVVFSHTLSSDRPVSRSILEHYASDLLGYRLFKGDWEDDFDFDEDEFDGDDDDEMDDEYEYEIDNENDIEIENEIDNQIEDEIENDENMEDSEIEDDDGEVHGHIPKKRKTTKEISQEELDEKMLKKKTKTWKSMYVLEQMMRFEKIYGYESFGPDIFSERREWIFDYNCTSRYEAKEHFPEQMYFSSHEVELGVFVGDMPAEKVEEARALADLHSTEIKVGRSFIIRGRNNDPLELFKDCQEKDNPLPIIQRAKDFIESINETTLAENKELQDKVEKALQYISYAYNKIGAPSFSSIYRLLVWQKLHPTAADSNFEVYKIKSNL